MKSILINSSCGFGSTGRNVLEIAEYMNSTGHECYIAHTSGSNYYKEYIIGNYFCNKLHALLSRIIGWQEIYSYFETKALCNFIKKNKFEIVNLNNIHSNYISYPFFIKKMQKFGIPIVLTLHDCWFYTGKCTHYSKDKCYKWKKQCGNCPRLKKDIISYFFDFTRQMLKQKQKLYNQSSDLLGVIGVSKWITNEAKQSILKQASNIVNIYNWIDFDIFKYHSNDNEYKKELGLDQYSKIILGVAIHWTDDKGLCNFETLAELLPEGYKIVLVGKYDKNRMSPKIKFVGAANDVMELVKYYNCADCYVSVSLEESFGKTIVEALSCGTPAIVYDSTATPELIGENCGFCVKAGDVNTICEKILKICKTGKGNYMNSCICFAKKNFNKKDNIDKYIEFFRKMINKSKTVR